MIPVDHDLVCRLFLPVLRIAGEEESLTGDCRHHRGLEWLGDEEGGLRPLTGEEALRIRGDEYYRHFERLEQLVHRVEPGAAVGELDIGEDQAGRSGSTGEFSPLIATEFHSLVNRR